MAGWAIVAIPAQDDYVWKMSSEKVPHMTMLFLGEQNGNPDEVAIASFVKHVADASLKRFGLDVDHRGPLGPEDADVLFFNNYGHQIDNLKNVRSALLQDQNIFEAYNSTQQYPEWTPHLTLGYPATPAKPDTRDYPGIQYVRFDKLALWTSDFAGYEFLLKDPLGMELAMGDNLDKALAHNDLAHHGVPGMKWGKHTKAGSSGGSGAPKKGFFDKPSAAKAIVLGSFGKKSAYTNPEALHLRKQAGKLRIASVLANVGSQAIGRLGQGNAGAQAVSTVLGLGAGAVGVASIVKGAQGASMQQHSSR
jgi:2'-5' RNA ligase